MKNILFTCLLVMFTVLCFAQNDHTIQNMTFKLPVSAVKVATSTLAPYNEVQQKFTKLPNTFKINDVYIGITDLKETLDNRDSLVVFKSEQDYDMEHEFKSGSVYISKIQTINENDIYSEYTFHENFGEYQRNIGQYFFMVYNYNIKKMFLGCVAFENQSNYAAATTILYDFLNTVSFPAFVNQEQSVSFTRNCGSGVGSVFNMKSTPGMFTSRVSQADANAQALAYCNQYGQFNADTFGTCTYYNTTKSGSYTKNNCVTGSIGSTVLYTVLAGKYAAASQWGADELARIDVQQNGQANANSIGTCTFKSKALTNVPFRKNNCIAPKVGSYVNYSAVAGAFTSTISQADADARARIAGQANANLNGSCN